MWRDEAALLDMLLAARKVQAYTQGVTAQQFYGDEALQDAVMRRIQIIGEAARQVSKRFRQSHPEVPWKQTIALRHTLVHLYFRVIPEKVWEVVEKDIPALIVLLEPLVPPDRPDGPQDG
ncbi:MAG: DUF86 domain-containing protein [Planctomycetes bacterium]|nr:DUF86 domain-containing protein [Planctomycetota bacterium]